jgi:DNA-binding phage protein
VKQLAEPLLSAQASQFARETGLSRERLYKALSWERSPLTLS